MSDIDVSNPAYWRRRAQEMRELCAVTPDDKARRVFLNIATHYDELASLTERLTESLPMLSSPKGRRN